MGDEAGSPANGGGGELYDRQIAKDAEPYWPQEKLRICITGAGGFIASHLARRLKNEGHHIIAVDWKRNEHMTVRRGRAVRPRADRDGDGRPRPLRRFPAARGRGAGP